MPLKIAHYTAVIFLRASALMAALFVSTGMGNSLSASDAPDRWSEGDITGLFPSAPEGWRISALDLEPIETPQSELERFANALNENFDAKARIRLKAVRHYILDEQKISITIDTDDIDAAINIDAMRAAFESDETTRTQLESEGFSAISHDDYLGIALTSKDKTGRAFKVGSTGVFALECSYFDCNDILDLMTAQTDFRAVSGFVAFDHQPLYP